MTSRRYPYLTQQLPPATTRTLPSSFGRRVVDLRHLSSNPLLTRVLPKPGGASKESKRLGKINEVQDEIVERRERFEKREAARLRLSDANRRRTRRMEQEAVQGRLGPHAAADVAVAMGDAPIPPTPPPGQAAPATPAVETYTTTGRLPAKPHAFEEGSLSEIVVRDEAVAAHLPDGYPWDPDFARDYSPDERLPVSVTKHRTILRREGLYEPEFHPKISLTLPQNRGQHTRWLQFYGALPWYRKLVRLARSYDRAPRAERAQIGQDMLVAIQALHDIKPMARSGPRV